FLEGIRDLLTRRGVDNLERRSLPPPSLAGQAEQLFRSPVHERNPSAAIAADDRIADRVHGGPRQFRIVKRRLLAAVPRGHQARSAAVDVIVVALVPGMVPIVAMMLALVVAV